MLSNKKTATIDMTEGAILSKMFRFAIPVLATMLLQQFYNAADAAVVGNFVSDQALAAVGNVGLLFSLLVSLFNGIGGGVSVVVAQFFGSSDERMVSHTIHCAYATAFISGVILTVVTVFLKDPLFAVLDIPQNSLKDADIYMTYIIIGIITMLIYNFAAGCLRAMGDSRHPLYYLIAASAVNIICNLVFVLVFNMGIHGVGFATLLSQIVTAVLVTVTLMRAKDASHLSFKNINFDLAIVKRFLLIGLPAGLTGAMFAVSSMFVKQGINGYGDIISAADTAEGQISNIAFIIVNAFNTAIMTFVGQNYGKGDRERVYRGALQGIGVGALITAVFCAVSILVAPYSMRLFSSDPEVVRAAVLKHYILMPLVFFHAFFDLEGASVRGCGKSIFPMVVSILGICGVRIFWIFCLTPIVTPHLTFLTPPQVLYLAFPISYLLVCIVMSVYFFFLRKKWLYS